MSCLIKPTSLPNVITSLLNLIAIENCNRSIKSIRHAVACCKHQSTINQEQLPSRIATNWAPSTLINQINPMACNEHRSTIKQEWLPLRIANNWQLNKLSKTMKLTFFEWNIVNRTPPKCHPKKPPDKHLSSDQAASYLPTKPMINLCASESQQTLSTTEKACGKPLCNTFTKMPVETNCNKMQMPNFQGWQTKWKHQTTNGHCTKLTSHHHGQASQPTSNELGTTKFDLLRQHPPSTNHSSLPEWLELTTPMSI